ncbi:type II toxin-antitoxin system HicB family antitoxin [Patescibacteria group bacterium]|nr:type II toxin-antitoxin system HicB family antitoxin [Patescibacteria group bacterium]MBU2579691.1 type II toxin-antitoxin system HicB family antitoxin [Patescibacteria group bacterium]MBU4030718.1 type II toxin-antitoxin system HicB family antitoxin [Patescibacteria group bacterium]MCG2808815.1 type II toxin-antitoxin system HicB family antitoxin [Candidatus Portnoybacteria bacterium]
MLTGYISQKLNKAQYKILEDGVYFGEIPGLKGVWASEKNLEECRETLREVLEEWLILKLQDGDKIPDFPKAKAAHRSPILRHA